MTAKSIELLTNSENFDKSAIFSDVVHNFESPSVQNS